MERSSRTDALIDDLAKSIGGAPIHDYDADWGYQLNLNDFVSYACADSYPIAPQEIEAFHGLCTTLGYWAAMAWAVTRFGIPCGIQQNQDRLGSHLPPEWNWLTWNNMVLRGYEARQEAFEPAPPTEDA